MEAKELARSQKKAKRDGRLIVFIDESGLSERPTRVRTWAPRGQMPIIERTRAAGEVLEAVVRSGGAIDDLPARDLSPISTRREGNDDSASRSRATGRLSVHIGVHCNLSAVGGCPVRRPSIHLCR